MSVAEELVTGLVVLLVATVVVAVGGAAKADRRVAVAFWRVVPAMFLREERR